ncbi:E3 ubiquitin-protein ligase MBR2-like isoform X2 [Salvia miltiorrhiza]|nr:E3 ubiquitin-protein ligase MBR2-like isoform X2 [Salvia miltiorrhiza]
MEGHTSRNDSFPETFDSNQGSPNSYVDRLASLGNRLTPVESRSSNHMLALHDGSIRRTSTPSTRVQTSRVWDRGESSSTGNNLQEQTMDDDSKMKFAWYSSSVSDIGPEDGPPEPSTTISPSYVGNQVTDTFHPLTFRQNHRHFSENSHCPSGLGAGRSHTLYESGRAGTEEILVRYASSSNLGSSSFSSSPSIENNDVSGPSLGTWGSSCKRKALEGSSRHFNPGGSSNSNQPMENVVQHPVPGRCTASRNLTTSLSVSSADRLEQLNSRSGVGTGRVCSGRFTSSSVRGITQNPVISRSSSGHQETVPSDPSRGPSIEHSTLYGSQPQSQPISNSYALDLMSPMTLPLNLNNTLSEPFVDVNEAGRTHRHPWNESLSSRPGSSSSSLLLSGERGYRADEEANLRSSVRHNPQYPTIVPASDTINMFEDQIDWSFTPGTSAPSRNYYGARSSSTAWSPHGNQTSQDQRRSLESAHWIPFPSIESISGSQRSPFAPLHLASASSERATPSHLLHQSDQRPSSFLMDARGDNTNSRNVLAAVEGRHRLIRHVLSAMRRGAPLRDEDYMLIDPFVNGFAELHDQNIDMRLDVDNMSYEELLALQEQIGNVSTGLSEEKIRGSMKKRMCGAVKASQAMEPCCICQEDYVAGDDIGILDCGHEFHTSCIRQWLILKNICPICKNTALGT